MPDKENPVLEILEWRINDEDQCPACGESAQGKELIAGGGETSPDQWPWHISLWRRQGSGAMQYTCGGAILNKKWSMFESVKSFEKTFSHHNFFSSSAGETSLLRLSSFK